MIVYDGIKTEFLNSVMNGTIAEEVRQRIFEKMGRTTPKSEFDSWKNSLSRMYMVLADTSIPDHAGIAIEYNVPQTSKRVDFIVSGYDADNQSNAVIIELKQWDELKKVDGKDALVETYTGGGLREVVHPCFGIDWKREQKAVEAEAKKGELGRFAPGLPKISDGQQLFVLNGLSKLATNGKMAIIQNGSLLFSGDAGSGPSEIRRYILENDWLDAIIQMSTDMFMNTGISTYIWVLNKNKPAWRAGKVQLIDASHCAEPRRKSIGTKRNDITDLCRSLIVEAYGDFKEAVYGDKNGIYCESKIFESTEFGYNKIVVERPQKDEDGNVIEKKGKPVADASQRDTENVPLTEDINTYFAREVLPYASDAWIDTKKTKIGYGIPMTRYFYEYQAPEPVEEIAARLHELELDIQSSLDELFGGE